MLCSQLWQHKCLWGPTKASTRSGQNTGASAVARKVHTGLWGEEEEGEARSYTSIVGQPPFSLGERNVYFEKFNMIFSGPDYFKNSMLTVVDGQVLKHITEALFHIYELQSLVL